MPERVEVRSLSRVSLWAGIAVIAGVAGEVGGIDLEVTVRFEVLSRGREEAGAKLEGFDRCGGEEGHPGKGAVWSLGGAAGGECASGGISTHEPAASAGRSRQRRWRLSR